MGVWLDYSSVQELYRKLDLRLTQQTRRDRLNNAVEMAILLGKIGNTPAEKARYAKRCTQEWMKLKMARLDHIRSKIDKGRISRDEMDTSLEDFWAGIDADIANGELPEA